MKGHYKKRFDAKKHQQKVEKVSKKMEKKAKKKCTKKSKVSNNVCSKMGEAEQANCQKWATAYGVKCYKKFACMKQKKISLMNCMGFYHQTAVTYMPKRWDEKASVPQDSTPAKSPSEVGLCFTNSLSSLKSCMQKVSFDDAKAMQGVTAPSKEQIKAAWKEWKKAKKRNRRNRKRGRNNRRSNGRNNRPSNGHNNKLSNGFDYNLP